MKYRFEIEDIRKETFFKHRRVRGGLQPTGKGHDAFRIQLLAKLGKNFVTVVVRQDKRADAERVVREILGTVPEEWSRMVARYEARLQRDKDRYAKRKQKQEIAELKRDVLQGHIASRRLARMERS